MGGDAVHGNRSAFQQKQFLARGKHVLHRAIPLRCPQHVLHDMLFPAVRVAIATVRIQSVYGMQLHLLRVKRRRRDDHYQGVLLLRPGCLRYGDGNFRVLHLCLRQVGLQVLHDGLMFFRLMFLIGGEDIVIVPFQALAHQGKGRGAQQ